MAWSMLELLSPVVEGLFWDGYCLATRAACRGLTTQTLSAVSSPLCGVETLVLRTTNSMELPTKKALFPVLFHKYPELILNTKTS